MPAIENKRPHMHRAPAIAVGTALTAALLGCGHGNAANPQAPAIAQTAAAADTPDPATAPTPAYKCDFHALLNNDDVQLYLSVMRDAAATVQHPSTADIAERQRVKAQAAAIAKADDHADAALMARLNPQQTPAQEAESSRVANMDMGMADDVIVDQRKLDSDRWDCINRKVEDAYPPPGTAYGDGDGSCVESAQGRANEARYQAELAANKKLLAPHRQEIEALETTVRHSGRSDGQD